MSALPRNIHCLEGKLMSALPRNIHCLVFNEVSWSLSQCLLCSFVQSASSPPVQSHTGSTEAVAVWHTNRRVNNPPQTSKFLEYSEPFPLPKCTSCLLSKSLLNRKSVHNAFPVSLKCKRAFILVLDRSYGLPLGVPHFQCLAFVVLRYFVSQFYFPSRLASRCAETLFYFVNPDGEVLQWTKQFIEWPSHSLTVHFISCLCKLFTAGSSQKKKKKEKTCNEPFYPWHQFVCQWIFESLSRETCEKFAGCNCCT